MGAVLMVVRVALLMSFETVEDHPHIRELVSFGEKVREEISRWRRAKRGA